MSKVNDVMLKKPCSLDVIFCIAYGLHCTSHNTEPWYGRICEMAGSVKHIMVRAVIFGMYPELETPVREHYHRLKRLKKELRMRYGSEKYRERKCNELISQIAEEYGLNKEGYLFNEATDDQKRRIVQNKNNAMTLLVHREAERMVDPLHIIMQGLCRKLSPGDCLDCIENFAFADIMCRRDDVPEKYREDEAYSIYKQAKECIKKAGIEDCNQAIDGDKYEKFIKTLDKFQYRGKEYNLQDVVCPIRVKRNVFLIHPKSRREESNIFFRLRTRLLKHRGC